MPPNNAARRAALAGLGLLFAIAAPNCGHAADAPDDLVAVRQECIAAAEEVQQRERAVAALEHTLDLLRRDVEGRQRGLDESRPQQARFLGRLEEIARRPPARRDFAFVQPLDRARSEMLIAAIMPVLRAQGRALIGDIERIAVLRKEIAEREGEAAAARAALDKQREGLAELVAARLDLTRKLLPEDPGAEARITKLTHDAADLGDLVKRAEAATERRDKELLARARAGLPKAKAAALTVEAIDPTRPGDLHSFNPPQTQLVPPVSGAIVRRFGAAEGAGSTKDGLSFAAPAAAEVVAPFDGRVIFAGPLRNLGLVLIIRHGDGYHSVLAGLGRTDLRVDQWALAGEPVGVLPSLPSAPAQAGEGRAGPDALYYELRRDGRPVDPQPWLATHEDGPSREPDRRNGDQRVRK